MAGETQTQTIQRHTFVNPNRRHDYLYDPVHFLSSERDHARATFQAHTSVDRVRRVPVYRTMFSELRHHPRFNVRLDVNDPVPKFVPRQWRGYADQAREALVRYTTFNYDPSVQVPTRNFPHVDVTGQERSKYFRRPIIPFMQQVAPDVVLAAARQETLLAEGTDRPTTPLVRNIGTQTDFRDSETQTQPYTPEYVVRPGSQPELLTLATLSYGRGLPAGLAEVEMIERARSKRAWEATLPPLSDMTQLDKRRRMMDEMERNEWALREQEIEKLQEARLQVLLQLLKQREENQQELNNRRLDRLWSRKQKERKELSLKIRYEHIKAIRKLTRKRKKVEGKLVRRDIIGEYADPGSQTFSPITRIGVFPDRGSEQYVVRSHFLQNYEGILQLESSLPRYVQQPKVKAPKQQTQTKEGFVKRQHRRMMQLVELHEYIKEMKNRGPEEKRPLRFLQKIEKPVPRPTTPRVKEPANEEEEKELAVILLQQLIRGRAVQAMMYEGKEKRRELIKELRSTHALQETEQRMKNQERLGIVALQRQRGLHNLKEAHVDEALGQLEGESLGDMYDFLSKELIRLQEERRIHAFAMLAERQRRVREAEESGRRQLEERRRREEDEIFKQKVKVHQESVNTYLEDIIIGSMDRAANQVARNEIQKLANQVNDVAYDMEGRRSQLESEEIVAEMVHQFLIPEVQKEIIREKVKVSQRRYLLAAHREIIKGSDDIIYEGTVESARSDVNDQDDAATSTDEQPEKEVEQDVNKESIVAEEKEAMNSNSVFTSGMNLQYLERGQVESHIPNLPAEVIVDRVIEDAMNVISEDDSAQPNEEKKSDDESSSIQPTDVMKENETNKETDE